MQLTLISPDDDELCRGKYPAQTCPPCDQTSGIQMKLKY